MKSFAIIVSALLLFSCGEKEKGILPVKQNITESVYASGNVESKNQYTAFATASGIVNKIYASEGDAVMNGSPVLSISNIAQQLNKDNAQLMANFSDINANQGKLREAIQAIDLARFKMKNDSLQWDRQKQLAAKNLNSKIELESATFAYENSKLNYSAAKTNYSDLKRQLDLNSQQAKNNLRIMTSSASDFTLKSMVDGEVYSLNVEVGELVSPQTPIAVLGEKDKYVLKMQVDEYDIDKLILGQKTMVTLNSDKSKVYEANITKIYPLMNTMTRTFEVEAEFTKRPERLFPNVSFEASIVIQTKKDALLIPREYLQDDNKVLLKGGKEVKVTTGLMDYKMVEILSGLKATDEIVKEAK
jgi:HlyD family secretion protein|tara:strand:+ start:10751 stop:11830 length:1080 start_codon:yes stop_codon:yes gene_type:complete